MKAGIFYWEIIILLLICVVPVYGAGSLEEYLVARSDSLQYNSIASDSGNVAWVEYGSGSALENYSRAIYRYSVATGRKELVISDTSWKRDLAVSGDRYVWSDGRGIFLYDDAKNRLTFLYSGNRQHSPCIDGNRVLWVETNESGYSLVMFDAMTGEHHIVGSSTSPLDLPTVSGDRVVYRKSDSLGEQIMLLNLTTMEATVLCDGPGPRTMPVIDGDGVVWVDGRDGPYQVYFYDLASGNSGPVSPSDSFQMYPDISGDLIVWEDYRNSSKSSPGFRKGDGDIRLYDRTTNVTEIVAEGPFSLEFPRVSGDYVVWADGRNEAHDIFLHHYPANRGENSTGTGAKTGYASVPTIIPTPDTRVRYYSAISKNEIDWYSLEPSTGQGKISFELRWNDPASPLSLVLVSPGGSTWHFSDTDDSRPDQAVRMTITGVHGGYLEQGKWTVAISGESVNGQVPYDLCWY
jgi:beta propeller repeat protein